MRGRKPKPTAVKEREGNPGKRPLNENEPKFDTSQPDSPGFLSGEAQKEWDRVVNELYSSGVITKMDQAALAGYCVARARWIEAEKMIAKLGAVYVNKKTGVQVRSPWVIISHQSLDKMLRFAAELGMTPSSRSRVTAVKREPKGLLEKYRGEKPEK